MERVMENSQMMKAEEQARIRDSQIDQLEKENARLVKQLKEVMKMNTHWQRYDLQREDHVIKVKKSNQELQDKIDDLERQIEDGIFQGLNTDHRTGEEASKVKQPQHTDKRDEATCTEQQVDQDRDVLRNEEVLEALTDKIATLKEKIVGLEIGRENRKKEDDDQLAMLREQVNVCVEDFNQERKDRERIHADNLKLRKHLALAENQIKVYEGKLSHMQKPHQTVYRAPRRAGYDEPCCYPEDRPHRAPFANEGRNNGYGHHGHRGYCDDLTELPSDVEIDGAILEDQVQNSTAAGDVVDGGESVGEPVGSAVGEKESEGPDSYGPMECPRCLAPFKMESEFLQHINKCMD